MRIRMKIPVSGVFHNIVEGVRVGDVVEVDDDNGARYISLGYAELADQRGEERAVAPKAEQATTSRVEPAEPEAKPAPKPRPKA